MRTPWMLEWQKYLVGSPWGGAIQLDWRAVRDMNKCDRKFNDTINEACQEKVEVEQKSRNIKRLEEAKTKTKPMINRIETERLRNRRVVIDYCIFVWSMNSGWSRMIRRCMRYFSRLPSSLPSWPQTPGTRWKRRSFGQENMRHHKREGSHWWIE